MRALVLAATFSNAAAQAPWPMFGHDAQHTGRSALSGPSGSAVAAQWTFSTGDSVESSPSLSQAGVLYIGSYDNTLYALSASSGAQLWAFNTSRGIASSPALSPDGRTVVVGSEDGLVYAVDAASGALSWKFSASLAIDASPVIGADGAVYVGSYDRSLRKLVDGQLQWQFTTGDEIASASALSLSGDTVYMCTRYYTLFALNASTGSKIWAFAPGGTFDAPPSVGYGLVFAAGSSTLFAVDASSGKQVWHFMTGYVIKSAPALGGDGTLYLSSGDGYLYALRCEDGLQLWKANLGYRGTDSTPALGADGTLYIGTVDGVVALSTGSTTGGTVLWKYTSSRVESSPIIGPGGVLYIGNDGGQVIALVDASSASATPSFTPSFTATPSATPSATASWQPAPAAAAGAPATASVGALAGASALGALGGAVLAIGTLSLWLKLRRPRLLFELLSEPLLDAKARTATSDSGKAGDAAARTALYSRLATLESTTSPEA